MRHATIMLAAALLTGCGGDFNTFGEGGGGAAEGGGGAAEGGGGAGGELPTGGGGEGGTASPCEGTPETFCDGDELFVCDAESGIEFVEDCAAADDGICLAGRCEYGLRAFMRFDEGMGNFTADSSPAALQGSLENVGWGPGHEGSAILFNGAGSVEVGDELNDVDLPFTITAWVNVVDTPAVMNVVATNTTLGGAYAGIWLDVDMANGNTVVVGFGNNLGTASGNRHGKRSAMGVSPGVWTHVAATFTAPNEGSIYIDGVEAGGAYSGTATYVATDPAPMHIGFSHWASAAMVGSIDEVRIYDRALTGGEVYGLANP